MKAPITPKTLITTDRGTIFIELLEHENKNKFYKFKITISDEETLCTMASFSLTKETINLINSKINKIAKKAAG